MLSKPNAGWTDFSLGGKTYYLSYLNDIPFVWLYYAIHGLKTMSPFVDMEFANLAGYYAW